MKVYYSWKKIVSQSTLFLIAVSFFSILAGANIEASTKFLATFPSLLIVLPAFIDACGDIAGTFASRLTTEMHLFGFKRRLVAENGEATVLLAIIFFTVISAAAFALSLALGVRTPSLFQFVAVTLLSSLVVVVASIIIAVLWARFLTRLHLDPDNFETPLLSTFCDLAGVVVFILIAKTILVA